MAAVHQAPPIRAGALSRYRIRMPELTLLHLQTLRVILFRRSNHQKLNPLFGNWPPISGIEHTLGELNQNDDEASYRQIPLAFWTCSRLGSLTDARPERPRTKNAGIWRPYWVMRVSSLEVPEVSYLSPSSWYPSYFWSTSSHDNCCECFLSFAMVSTRKSDESQWLSERVSTT